MEIEFTFLAQEADVTDPGPLLQVKGGCFEDIELETLPQRPPRFALVTMFRAHHEELDEPHVIGVDLFDPSGGELLHLKLGMPCVARQFADPTRPIPIPVAMDMDLGSIPFEEEGAYEFRISVDGGPTRSLPLHVHEKSGPLTQGRYSV